MRSCNVMHLPGFSQEKIEEIRTVMKRQEGTFVFDYTFDGLFDPSLGTGIILEITTGQILFRLERDSDLNVHFYHSSPGTSTRVARVSLKEIEKNATVKIIFTWSHEQIALAIGSNGRPIFREGHISKKTVPC